MFLRDIMSNDYKLFERMSLENRQIQISAVQYVQMLGVTTNTNVKDWNVIEIFGTGDGNKLVTDKNEINRRFFTRANELKSVLPKELLEVEPEIERQIEEASREILRNLKRRASDAMENNKQRLYDCMARVENMGLEVTKSRNQLSALTTRSNPAVDEIRKVAKSSFWQFYKWENGFVGFTTRQPITLVLKNPSAGIDITLPMGHFRAFFNLTTLALFVTPHEGNLCKDGYFHPHVNYGGAVCWGTALHDASAMIAEMRLDELFTLLAANLSNYNSGNPYISLETFKTSGRAIVTMGQLEKRIWPFFTIGKDPKIDDVECEECGEMNPPDRVCDCNYCGTCENLHDNCSCEEEQETDEEIAF